MIAMGKLGGREMTAASDLDLIIVYDFEGEGAQSQGPKSLPGQQYYTRFTQRLIAALSAQTAEGSLYQVDMRLRPSGSQGPVATKLASFIDYQRNSAWTWEHLALTRARVVSGPPELRQAIERTISGGAAPDARPGESRRRRPRHARQDRRGEGDARHLGPEACARRADRSRVPRPVPATRQRARASRGARSEYRGARSTSSCRRGVLTLGDAEVLVPAATLYHTLTQCLRLCLDKPFVPDEAPRALKDLLARASDMPDFATLEAHAQGHARRRARALRPRSLLDGETGTRRLPPRPLRSSVTGLDGQRAGDGGALALAALDAAGCRHAARSARGRWRGQARCPDGSWRTGSRPARRGGRAC